MSRHQRKRDVLSGSGRRKLILRVLLTALVSIALLSYGIVKRLAIETFLGMGLALYSGYGVWLARFALQELKVELHLSAPAHNPFHTRLSWELRLLSQRHSLPRLFMRVKTIWEEADASDPSSPKRYDVIMVLHARSCNAGRWMQELQNLPVGVYRHGGTTLATGDVWGWFTKEIVLPPAGHEVVLLPQAALWDENDPLIIPYGLAEDGRTSPASSDDYEGHRSAELRPYRIGDASRAIHWRRYMKNRQLAVRQRQPEASHAIALLIDEDLVSSKEGTRSGEAVMALAAEWLWTAWKQEREVEVWWLRDPKQLQQPIDIARELVLRYREHEQGLERSPGRQATKFERSNLAAPQIQDAVLISASRDDSALHKARQCRNGLRLAGWLTALAEHDTKEARGQSIGSGA